MRLCLCLFLVLVHYLSASSQDIIYKKDKTKIDCKVIEVGALVITYSLTGGGEPFLVLSKNEILVLQYANGEHEIFTARSYQRESKPDELEIVYNTLSFNLLDILFLRMQVSHEHINKEGNVGFRVPLTIGLYEDEFTYFSGFDLNFYPYGQDKVSYFLGPKFRIGHVNDYIFSSQDFVAIMFNNGFRVTITPSFIFSAYISLGAVHSYNYDNTIPMASLSLLLGFKV